MKRIIKIISLALVLTLISISLLSCGVRPLAQGGLAGKVVGTVGTHKVYYEELYFLANGYKSVAEDNFGDDKTAVNNAIWDYVNENITQNYAVLDLCESNGLKYNSLKLQSDVSSAIESTIESEFKGDKSAYYKEQLEAGITDHYYRFCLGVDLLYGELAEKYQSEGKIPATDEELKNYISENFIHTWHIAIYVDKGDDYQTEKARAEEAKKLLDSGISMYTLIGGAIGGKTYNENNMPESLHDAYGYYFPKGTMDKAYEDAAWSLKVEEHSAVIESPENNCFYIIERLPVSESEINANLNYLSDMVTDSIVVQDLEKYQEKLTFKPNEYALSLDMSNLTAPKNGGDYQIIFIVALVIVSVGVIIALVIVFRTIRAKRFHKKHQKKKSSKR